MPVSTPRVWAACHASDIAAMKLLVSNGTYMQILTKWGVQSGAIPASQVKINGGTS